MADVQVAYKGDVKLALDYRENENSNPVRYEIETERIAYVMIESMYENVHILPVIYISVNLSNDMYSKVVNSVDTSEFYLRIRKRDALSNTSVYKDVVNDTFSYVTSSTSPNYSGPLNSADPSGTSYLNITIGLVSSEMTNILRKNFNGIFNNISEETLIKDVALGGVPNLVMQPIKYSNSYDSLLIPPITSRYKLLAYLYNKFAFYDSYFTFFMDFKKTYLVSRNAEAVDAGDGSPLNVMINIKDYTAAEAFNDGFTMKNGAYVVNVNASDTNVIVNTATDKVTNNIIAYSDATGTQNLSVTTNPNANNTEKTTYVRANNGAAVKNELQSNAVLIELLKQNLDGDIFTPNKIYMVTNYSEYSMYDGAYYLSYKREFYYINTNEEFLITCNVGLKKTVTEEAARATVDSYSSKSLISAGRSRKTTTASKSASLTTTKKSSTSSSSSTSSRATGQQIN